ncbi:hypothetical protein [Mesorhizobium amorphae]|uniref:hypothetical protein n=1 Tax=Mesorhizobium amorphae TaxID=71433 RepID=UPI001185DB81|nr:hypothetical protein [Mesorhizobium amorphae]
MKPLRVLVGCEFSGIVRRAFSARGYDAWSCDRNYQRAAQIVQPWWFGEPQFKGIGLYLKNLPKLVATNKLSPPKPGTPEHKEWSKVHRSTGWNPDRWRERSRFFPSVAEAMAAQWDGNPAQGDLFVGVAA